MTTTTTPLPAFTTLGSGPTLLMLHDVGGGHLAFAPQVESFALAGYRALAWDMPGYGRSAPVEPYNFKALAQSCASLIDALGCGDVSLLGHGIGGMVALELVARRPELVNRLILCGALSTCRPPEIAAGAPAEAWRSEFIALHAGSPLPGAGSGGDDMAALAATLVPRWIGPAALPEGVRLALDCMARVRPAIWRRAWYAVSDFDRSAVLPAIRVPTLVIAGEYDREAPPALLGDMADRIDGCGFVEMHGVGHLMQLEAPESFDALVLDFLARTRPVSKPNLH